MEIVSQSGLVIKNNGNDVDAKAILWRNGVEQDVNEAEYIYTWQLRSSSGNDVVRTYQGKSVVVSKGDIVGKGTLTCEVSQ